MEDLMNMMNKATQRPDYLIQSKSKKSKKSVSKSKWVVFWQEEGEMEWNLYFDSEEEAQRFISKNRFDPRLQSGSAFESSGY